jgi:hypothetical protein
LKRIERDEHRVAIRLFPFTRQRDAGMIAEAPKLIAIDPALRFWDSSMLSLGDSVRKQTR